MKAVLLVNLGSPNALTKLSIRKFLARFLSDRRVVGLPKIVWYPILYGIILLIRPKYLLSQYQQIWIHNKSPLIHYTDSQRLKLEAKLSDQQIRVLHAFSYSNPDVEYALSQLDKNVDELIILPLYPQFSSTTTMSVFDQIGQFYSDKKYLPHIKFVSNFHDNMLYIQAIANLVNKHISVYGKCQKLIFSFHSLPQKIIKSGDMYYEQCQVTAQLIAAKLKLLESEYLITFQSKFGRSKWIGPATAEVIAQLPKSGFNHIAVVCPGFISDCLETLEEIAVTNREIFVKNGGEKYYYIPCLNDSDACIDMLQEIIKE